ncbi:MAG: ferrochelatase [Bacteroidales bacterium]|nr:ferrochelatase [Bacteroidales bacterium]
MSNLKPTRAVLLINIGSPNSYKTKDVRRYLREFLNDKRVINIHPLLRFILVNGIIVPFRAKKSAGKYKEIWSNNGSPLIFNSIELSVKLQAAFKDNADIYMAMRYGNPGIKKVLAEIKRKQYSELIVFPMYPQYASSTSGSSIEKVFDKVKFWENIPNIKIIHEFWRNPIYINTLADKIKNSDLDHFDHLIISFHGLPLSHVYKTHENKTCNDLNCLNEMNNNNKYCYQSACYRTAELLAKKINISKSDYSVGFQSRLSKNWLTPFTEELLIDLAKKNKKKILVVCPSFVADCLETLHEIQIEYSELFKASGGETLKLVSSLNSDDPWVENLRNIILPF